MKPFLHRSMRGRQKRKRSKFEERSFQLSEVKQLESTKQRTRRLRFLRDRRAKSTKKLVYSSEVLKKASIWLGSHCSKPLVLRNMKILPFLRAKQFLPFLPGSKCSKVSYSESKFPDQLSSQLQPKSLQYQLPFLRRKHPRQTVTNASFVAISKYATFLLLNDAFYACPSLATWKSIVWPQRGIHQPAEFASPKAIH